MGKGPRGLQRRSSLEEEEKRIGRYVHMRGECLQVAYRR